MDMIFFRKHFFCFLLLVAPLFSLFSCDDEEGEKEYSVDSELYPYLQRFLDEAAKRGKSFDVVGDGLIMEFADLESPVVGLCTYSNPIKVQIDKKYWKETANSANQENLREDVVFHELGHGLLRRSHDNSTLPNTEWKTIMCGGTEVDGRSWAVNFRRLADMENLRHLRWANQVWARDQYGRCGRLRRGAAASRD